MLKKGKLLYVLFFLPLHVLKLLGPFYAVMGMRNENLPWHFFLKDSIGSKDSTLQG